MDYEAIREEGRFDDVGTVRVCDKFGTVAVYIKVDENSWQAVYVDPARCQMLIPDRMLADSVATNYRVVFAPKGIA